MQSVDLLRRRPRDFAVLTGEDALFYGALVRGSDGGILAAAHVETERFDDVRQSLLAGDTQQALAQWRGLAEIVRLLFAEPNPAPIKHWLWRSGVIDSPEVRLPITPVSDDLAGRIDRVIAATVPQDSIRSERRSCVA